MPMIYHTPAQKHQYNYLKKWTIFQKHKISQRKSVAHPWCVESSTMRALPFVELSTNHKRISAIRPSVRTTMNTTRITVMKLSKNILMHASVYMYFNEWSGTVLNKENEDNSTPCTSYLISAYFVHEQFLWPICNQSYTDLTTDFSTSISEVLQ